jgi:hypothetical protein
MRLESELKLFGATVGAEQFKELLADLHNALHPSWTEEQLLYHPRDGLRYCEAIRARAGQGLPDEMILRRLNNLRKNPEE